MLIASLAWQQQATSACSRGYMQQQDKITVLCGGEFSIVLREIRRGVIASHELLGQCSIHGWVERGS